MKLKRAKTYSPKLSELASSWHVFDAADRIEQRLGKIVVTASQATLWRCLRVAGVESGSDGWGRLLATMPPLPS